MSLYVVLLGFRKSEIAVSNSWHYDAKVLEKLLTAEFAEKAAESAEKGRIGDSAREPGN